MSESESSFEYTPYMYEQHYRKQIEIFGPERMDEIQDNEATPESTQELVNAITAVCSEPDAKQHHGITYRQFFPSADHEVVVQTNPDDTAGFGSSIAESGVVSMSGYKRGKASRPKDEPRRYRYQFSESIFVDPSGRAHIERGVWARSHRSRVPATSSFKPATETEVQEALAVLAELAGS